METIAQDHIAFYLTGRVAPSRNERTLRPIDRSYRPALLARYKDLTALRYDFPLVLNTQGTPDRAILSLARLVDETVESLKEDPNRDRLARHAYQLECELRRILVRSDAQMPAGHGDFATLWEEAARNLTSSDSTIVDSAKRLWALFHVSGELVDVDFAMPARIARHLWNVIQSHKAKIFRDEIERLLLKLHSILRAELANSDAGRSPKQLQASLGGGFANAFDFNVMSEVLIRAKPAVRISEDRRNRIHHLIDVLEQQRFFPIDRSIQPYEFVFYRCASAMEAYKERREEAVELLKAMEIARLETSGEFRESNQDRATDDPLDHTAIFETFETDSLSHEDLATLPGYLVCKYSSELDAEETMQIADALSAGLPIKVLLQTDDLFEPSVAAQRMAGPERHAGLASRSRFIVENAIGLGDAFVLQVSASALFQAREGLRKGFEYPGSSLLSIFSGVSNHCGSFPPYLVAAAASESRAFPTIIFDPTRGSKWAEKLDIGGNPGPEESWTMHTFEYEDEAMQWHSEQLPFTLADFIVMDDRFGSHFALMPNAEWNSAMVPIHEALTQLENNAGHNLPTAIPSIALVDVEGRFVRAILDRRILQAVLRCQEQWQSLQELGGIHNSFAERAEALAAARFEEQLRAALAKAQVSAPSSTASVIPAANTEPQIIADEPMSAPEEHHGDEPYIETARCTSCNECTQVNNKMFAYNDEKQAYIANANAGTYRQLVEAAEGCQVSVIHPGKPRNPKEPGLDELIKRAEPFN